MNKCPACGETICEAPTKPSIVIRRRIRITRRPDTEAVKPEHQERPRIRITRRP